LAEELQIDRRTGPGVQPHGGERSSRIGHIVLIVSRVCLRRKQHVLEHATPERFPCDTIPKRVLFCGNTEELTLGVPPKAKADNLQASLMARRQGVIGATQMRRGIHTEGSFLAAW
jgi:hypothetical protein